MKRNARLGLSLQLVALGIVLGYYLVPDIRAMLDLVGELKASHGYGYSALATALFGGIVPYGVLLATRRVSSNRLLAELAFYVGFWVWKGVEVDALYRAQGWLFGNTAAVGVVAAKVAVDQFIYNPLWAAPTQAVCYLWKDAGFSVVRLRERLRQEPLWRRVVVVLASTWVVWIPAVAIIYALPAPLQVPLFNLVLCFWSVLLAFISSRQAERLLTLASETPKTT